jgi:hypothetical protein
MKGCRLLFARRDRDSGSPVWSLSLPQGALGGIGAHLRIEGRGGGGHWGGVGPKQASGLVSDRFIIRWVRYQIG